MRLHEECIYVIDMYFTLSMTKHYSVYYLDYDSTCYKRLDKKTLYICYIAQTFGILSGAKNKRESVMQIQQRVSEELVVTSEKACTQLRNAVTKFLRDKKDITGNTPRTVSRGFRLCLGTSSPVFTELQRTTVRLWVETLERTYTQWGFDINESNRGRTIINATVRNT